MPPELPAGRRVYDTVDIRRQILEHLDPEDLVGIIILEKAFFMDAASFLYRTVPFRIASGLQARTKRQRHYCDSIRHVRCHEKEGDIANPYSFRLDEKLVLRLRKKFTRLRSISYKTASTTTNLQLADDGTGTMDYTANISRRIADLDDDWNDTEPFFVWDGITLESNKLKLKIRGKKWSPFCAQWLRAGNLHPDVWSLDLTNVQCNLDDLAQLCGTRTGDYTPLRVIRSRSVQDYQLAPLDSLLKAANPDLRLLQLAYPPDTNNQVLSLTQLPDVLQLVATHGGSLRELDLCLSGMKGPSEAVRESDIKLLDETLKTRLKTRLKRVTLRIRGASASDLPYRAIGRNLACLKGPNTSYEIYLAETINPFIGEKWQHVEMFTQFMEYYLGLSPAQRRNLWEVPLAQLEITDLGHFLDIRFDAKDRPLRRSFEMPVDALQDIQTALDKSHKASEELASTALDVRMTTNVTKATETGSSGVDPAERDIEIMRGLQGTIARNEEVLKQWEEVKDAMEGMLKGQARLKAHVVDMEERQKKREPAGAAVVDAEAGQISDVGGAVPSALDPATEPEMKTISS